MTETAQKENLVYFVNSKMYINVTNLCTCRCVFCIRNISSEVEGVNMWIDKQSASAQKIIEQIKLLEDKMGDEIVFCGYGEPLIEIEAVKEIAKFIKDNYPNIKIRVNTNGHANLIHKRNVVDELKGLVNSISISLNAHNAKLYNELTQNAFKDDSAYEGMKEFARLCSQAGIDTYMSVVTGYKNFRIDVNACEEIAKKSGAKLRIREYLEEGYS
ncbi:MAG: TatD family nuclease-associated radical SAM protein [Candidatus Gastranaerophilales bacterium]|nr:TatD family nuclease-associated radical SAM protein [Candidatus Gastranaerophilales bacterium]